MSREIFIDLGVPISDRDRVEEIYGVNVNYIDDNCLSLSEWISWDDEHEEIEEVIKKTVVDLINRHCVDPEIYKQAIEDKKCWAYAEEEWGDVSVNDGEALAELSDEKLLDIIENIDEYQM